MPLHAVHRSQLLILQGLYKDEAAPAEGSLQHLFSRLSRGINIMLALVLLFRKCNFPLHTEAYADYSQVYWWGVPSSAELLRTSSTPLHVTEAYVYA